MADDAPCGPALPPGFKREPQKNVDNLPRKRQGPEIANEEEINIDDEDGAPLPVPATKPVVSPSVTAAHSQPPQKKRYGPSLGDITKAKEPEQHSEPLVGSLVGPPPPHLVAAAGKSDLDDEAEDWDRLRNPAAEKADKQGREDWMLSLPPERNPLSLTGPRKFDRTGNSSLNRGDTSSWTDTPEDRKRRLENRSKGIEPLETDKDALEKRRNSEMSQLIDTYNKQRQAKSLVEEHRAQLQAAGPGASAPRPFDKEKDLAMRRPIVGKEKEKLFTEAKKLNNNFSSGSYL